MTEPLLLALETATRRPSAALVRGDTCLCERVASEEGSHSESLLARIDEVLRETGTDVDGLGGFAVAVGPGSFTSLRIGVATVKGLGFGSDLPVAAVPTLAALAEPMPPGETWVPVLDARKGELYAAAFARDGAELRPQLAEDVYSPAELAESLSGVAGALSLVGEDAEVLSGLLAPLLPRRTLVVRPEAAGRAAAVGRLGGAILAAGQAVSSEELVPRYLRRAQAEVARTGLRTESDAL